MFRFSWTRRNLLWILLNEHEISLYLLFSDWLGSKQNSVWTQINWKMVNTIWFWVDLTRFKKDFSVCGRFSRTPFLDAVKERIALREGRRGKTCQRIFFFQNLSLGIMRDQFRAPFKPLNTIECCDGLRGFRGCTHDCGVTTVYRTAIRLISADFFPFRTGESLARSEPDFRFSLNKSYTQRNIFKILLNQTEIILCLVVSDWFGAVNGHCPFGVPNQ